RPLPTRRSSDLLAHRAQRPVGQPHFAARQRLASGGGRVGNVGGSDGTEKLALVARLGADRELEALELGLAGLGARQRVAGNLFQVGAALLELLHVRSEEHTSELQSRENIVCRLLLEKKK